jgi:2'-5' RNA ligase
MGSNGPLVAAAEIATGAMIALVPSAADLARLAVDGGEPADQLHCTVLYLGDAATLDEHDREQLIAWADAVGNGGAGWQNVEADAFGAAIFSPTGDEPCAVLLLSGPEVAEFYENTLADVTEFVKLPDDRHLPYIPHITLAYLNPAAPGVDVDMTADAIDRTGPVVFDTLRVAIGGEVHDVPIGPSTPDPSPSGPDAAATETQVPSEGVGEPGLVVAAASDRRERFEGCLRCFGPAHDGDCLPAL